jgi:hypothetical protein
MSNERIDQKAIMALLDWCYEKSLSGLGKLESCTKLAEDYLKKNDNNALKASKNLIKWQTVNCTASGFVTGLGGFATLPIMIPANVGSVLLIQIRMVAAIAHIGGYDLKSDQVKSSVFLCLLGNAAIDVLKNIGIRVGNKIAYNIINKLSGETLIKINQRVGFRLFTKFGQTGIVNFGKAIPFFGGVVGGSFDFITTKNIGDIAIKIFLENK